MDGKGTQKMLKRCAKPHLHLPLARFAGYLCGRFGWSGVEGGRNG